MDNPSLTATIIHRLSDAVHPDDIIFDICQETGMRRQFPLLTLIALGIFIGRLGIIGYSTFMLVITIEAYTSTTVGPLNLPDTVQYL